MNSTERIYLRMERLGFPCDIALINVLEPSPEGALPFEAVRAIFAQRAHRAPVDPDAGARPAGHRRGPLDISNGCPTNDGALCGMLRSW
jgi:hypothetical protein